ncbi:SpoIIE family protein phosphatase [bacterium]|nr:SpoIIE family protein phosphatase [bacterium]
MRFTLRAKLIALTTLVVALTMASVTYFFSLRQLNDQRAAVESQMVRFARNIATMQLVDRQNWRGYQNYITQLLAFNDDIIYIAIYDDRNSLRAHALNPNLIDIEDAGSLTRRQEAEIVTRLDKGQIASESRDDLRTQEVNIRSGDRILGSVRVGFSLIELNNAVQERILRNTGVALLFIVVSSLLSMYMGGRLTGPLRRLSEGMEAIARGSLDQKVRVENRDEIGQLAHRFNEMVEGLRERNIIEKLGQEISKSFQLDELVGLVRDRLSNAINADRARIFLAQGQEKKHLVELTPGNNQSVPHLPLDSKMRSFFSTHQDGFSPEETPESMQTAFKAFDIAPRDLLIPMLAKDELFGLLVFSMNQSPTTQDTQQRQFATTLATQATIALENALLYDDLREQDRIKRELEIAREVQHRLLPSKMPRASGFQFDGICHSAQEVGGDYFDFLPIAENKLGIVVADVSGKGTSASFYMAEIKGMMVSLASTDISPKELLSTLNVRLYESLDRKIFATMIYGVLNVQTREFRFVRAGHNSLLHIGADRSCQLFTPSGIGLGLDPGKAFNATLEESQVSLKKGDSLLLFTDGLTESMNRHKEEFGEDRLIEVVRSNGHSDPVPLRERIFEEIKAHANGAEQHDDLTMVLVHCEN